MDLEIKICGLKTPECVLAALDGGASHIGFIFFEKSPRTLTPEQAATLASLTKNRAKTVAVTVDADDTLLGQIVKHVQPDLLQLHGHETPQRVAEIKKKYGLPVIKAFAIHSQNDFKAITSYQGIADRFLFDAKAPKGSDLPGGNGVPFDWTLLETLDDNIDYMLSGGLNADNIASALTQSHAKAIDISSGVESSAGVKDKKKIDAFFNAVKKAFNNTGETS